MSSKPKNIGEQAKLGIVYNSMSRLSGTFMQFFGSIALARLLDVKDFGLVQMSMMVVEFATKMGEFGFSMGLVQRREEVNEEHINTLFLMDFFFKLTLFAIIMVCLPFLAEYFREPRLSTVLPGVAMYMVLDCFETAGTTMLDRQMNFLKSAQIEIIGRFTEIFSSVTLALFGFGVWSLILSKILGIAIVGFLASRAIHWWPSLKFNVTAAKELFRFGGWVFLRNFFRYLADNADRFVISRYLGAQQLGYYSKAFDLMRLPQRRITRALNSVMFAAFSRVQDQPEKVKAGFQKAVLAVSLASYPLLIGAMVIAPEFVAFVFGEKWAPMTLPLQIMCVSGVLRSIDPFLNSVVTATGFVRNSTFRRLIEFILLAIAVYFGVEYGIVGVSVAVVIVSIIVMFLMVNLLKSMGVVGWREYLGPQMPGFLASLGMAAAMLACRYLVAQILGLPSAVSLFAMMLVGAVTYVGALWLVKPKRVVALWQESALDLRKATSSVRKKFNGMLSRWGWATGQ
ncbi:MAG: lipopolysaccharide biosynthesis protein [bacterium]